MKKIRNALAKVKTLAFLVGSGIAALLTPVKAYANPKDLEAVTEPINRLGTFVAAILGAPGLIFLALGVYHLALAMKNDRDPGLLQQCLGEMLAGGILVSFGVVLAFIRG